ncbi:MAG: hypothetical protein R6W48_05690, partial [Gaiellaceae bacterium]
GNILAELNKKSGFNLFSGSTPNFRPGSSSRPTKEQKQQNCRYQPLKDHLPSKVVSYGSVNDSWDFTGNNTIHGISELSRAVFEEITATHRYCPVFVRMVANIKIKPHPAIEFCLGSETKICKTIDIIKGSVQFEVARQIHIRNKRYLMFGIISFDKPLSRLSLPQGEIPRHPLPFRLRRDKQLPSP